MANKLLDKVAVITGSSSGNGRAIALALAAEGASVVCSDIRREAREGGYEGDILTPTDDVIRANGGKAKLSPWRADNGRCPGSAAGWGKSSPNESVMSTCGASWA
jgi:NAD(P)-dependent dehydrogenase (short-subunit alcohol dehydrogenase family)